MNITIKSYFNHSTTFLCDQLVLSDRQKVIALIGAAALALLAVCYLAYKFIYNSSVSKPLPAKVNVKDGDRLKKPQAELKKNDQVKTQLSHLEQTELNAPCIPLKRETKIEVAAPKEQPKPLNVETSVEPVLKTEEKIEAAALPDLCEADHRGTTFDSIATIDLQAELPKVGTKDDRKETVKREALDDQTLRSDQDKSPVIEEVMGNAKVAQQDSQSPAKIDVPPKAVVDAVETASSGEAKKITKTVVEIKEEFSSIPPNPKNKDVILLPNDRFLNIQCILDTIVTIQADDSDDSDNSDDGEERTIKIHANRIALGKHVFIAAQAPQKDDVKDFYQMIREKGCEDVVILVSDKEVNDQKLMVNRHWPIKPGDPLEKVTGCIFVSAEEDLALSYRMITLKQEEKVLRLHHLTEWPDFGVVAPQVMAGVVEKVKKAQINPQKPLLVHCRAGVGRTGTFVAAMHLSNNAGADIKETVIKMREQRASMVQTEEQYRLLYQMTGTVKP